jgi:hypothetical protein
MSVSIAATGSPQAGPVPVTQNAVHDGHEFLHDLLEVVNPLQHIPVVATLYRAVTHDAIEPVERVAGDTLYGGFMGFASAVGELLFQKVTGKDVGDTVLAFLTGDHAPDANTATASAAATASTPADADLGQRVSVAYRKGAGLATSPEMILAP